MNKKKKIIGFLAVIVIAVMAAVNLNVSNNSQTAKLSDISLANVEALADWEIIIGTICMQATSFCEIEADGYFRIGTPYM